MRLRVTDPQGATATDLVTITVGNTRPTATIALPSPGTTWKVGDPIAFRGSATDTQDGAVPAARLAWSLILHHCPSNCHTHPIQSWLGVDRGTFTTPDHEYPAHLELRLTARDSGGLTDTRSVRLDPRTVDLRLETRPDGLTLGFDASQATAQFTRRVIIGSRHSISAATTQLPWGWRRYSFRYWSDGGAPTHNIIAPATNTTYTALYTRSR